MWAARSDFLPKSKVWKAAKELLDSRETWQASWVTGHITACPFAVMKWTWCQIGAKLIAVSDYEF